MAIQYYIIDLETNGTKSSYHEVTEISIIRCSDRNQLNKLIRIEFPKRTNATALSATGRTYADLFKGDPKIPVVEACEEFLKQDSCTEEERCIIGHNIIKFDKRFLFALWNSCGKVFPANLWLDTVPYFKEHLTKIGSPIGKYNLDAAVRFFDVEPRGPLHTAKADTQNNYILWDKLQKSGNEYIHLIKRFSHKEELENG